jgi:hypothetical protein
MEKDVGSSANEGTNLDLIDGRHFKASFSSAQLCTALRSHIASNYPMLLDGFVKDTGAGANVQHLPQTATFNWTGPCFTIVQCMLNFGPLKYDI